MSLAADAMAQLRAAAAPGEAAPVVARLAAAARAGDGEAAALLATLHAAGAWVPSDLDRALDHLARAAERGSSAAQRQLDLIAPPGSSWAARRAALATTALLAVPPRVALCEAPRVRLCEGFVPPAWCDWLIAKAQGRLAPALTGYGEGVQQDASRTNSAFELDLFDTDVIVSVIRARIGALLAMPVAAMELPQVLHYAVGQEFKLHADYMQRGPGFSERIATFLLYLNDDFEGGETWFPRADLKVRPRKGGALYFANVGAGNRPDPLSVHAGLSPARGEKFLFSQWIHDGVPNGLAR